MWFSRAVLHREPSGRKRLARARARGVYPWHEPVTLHLSSTAAVVRIVPRFHSDVMERIAAKRLSA